MNGNLQPKRLLVGLAVTFLVVGCASGATASPSSPAVATATSSVAVATPTPTPTPTAAPAPTPTASPEPTFSRTGEMTVGRQIHTATLLANGRVLVAGGYDNKDAELASAVLYDPTTGTFSPTGSLRHARGSHTATLLSDGRVLIAGGGSASWTDKVASYLASAELYDPKTGKFKPTGSMATTREYHTATQLTDGRVLITGGNDAGAHAVASAELYDPKTGTFSPTGSMASARGFHTATPLSDGRVLIVGGYSAGWTVDGLFLASAEIYDPKTGTFSPTGSLAAGRGFQTATLLSDGRVLIAGGDDSVGHSLHTAELYDPETGTFSPTGSLRHARTFHAATRLADGSVLLAGGDPSGWSYADAFLDSAEIYDPKTGTFSPTGSLTHRRVFHSATLLADGRVLVAGGTDPTPLTSAEIYDPKSGE